MRWNLPDRLSGAGIILFPTTTSTANLAGAVFVTTNFPDFIVAAATSPTPSPVRVQPLGSPFPRHYQPLPNIASSSRHSQSGSAPAGRFQG